MKSALVSAAVVAAFAGNVAHARCTGIDKDAELLAEIAKASCTIAGGDIVPGSCDGTLGKAQGLAKKAVDYWNDIANGGPGEIGPRSIDLGHEDHGKLITPGKRLWVVAKPTSGSHTVTIKYRDGKAGAMVDLCEADAKGNTRYLDYIEIDKGSEKGGSKTVKVDNGWLLIDMRGTGLPTTSYSYSIEVN
jgi:hypothetical protein